MLGFSASAPNLTAREWLIIAPQPQDDPSQTVNYASLSIDNSDASDKTAFDLSLEKRPVQEVSFLMPGDGRSHQLNLQAVYDVSLNSRWLEPGSPTVPVAPLSEIERAADTCPTRTTDYVSPAFQAWLDKNQLRRAADEDSLTYARRVFEKIRAEYVYSFDPNQDRRASAICTAAAADCGGLSNLFVAALRQASIPARLDAGRWVGFEGTEDGLDNVHVKSEFYVDGVGWVPVEMSGAVSNKAGDVSLFFGRDTGQFLTMSVNTDYVIDAQDWGTKQILALQGVCCWETGTGSLDGLKENDRWSVSEINSELSVQNTSLKEVSFQNVASNGYSSAN